MSLVSNSLSIVVAPSQALPAMQVLQLNAGQVQIQSLQIVNQSSMTVTVYYGESGTGQIAGIWAPNTALQISVQASTYLSVVYTGSNLESGNVNIYWNNQPATSLTATSVNPGTVKSYNFTYATSLTWNDPGNNIMTVIYPTQQFTLYGFSVCNNYQHIQWEFNISQPPTYETEYFLYLSREEHVNWSCGAGFNMLSNSADGIPYDPSQGLALAIELVDPQIYPVNFLFSCWGSYA